MNDVLLFIALGNKEIIAKTIAFKLLFHHYTILEWRHQYSCTEQTLVHMNYKTWAHAWLKLNMEIHEDISLGEPSKLVIMQPNEKQMLPSIPAE